MNIQILQRFVCITLFLHICLPIFSEQPNISSSKQPSLQNHDQFEQTMSGAREHTQTISFCIQQLLQTINADKIKMSKKQKQCIILELLQLQDLTTIMLEELYVQNTKNALFECIILNNTLMNFMIKTLSNGLPSINLTHLMGQLQKKSQKNMPDEIVLNMHLKNSQNIDKLIYATDHVGLTWYNYIYRSLKKYNGYSIAKACAIGAATALIAGLVLCTADAGTGIASIDKYIGLRPRYIQSESEYIHADNGQPMTYSNSTVFQGLYMALHKLTSVGLLQTGALISFSYKDLLAGMYKDAYEWAKEDGAKKYHQLDQKLSGTGKTTYTEAGYEKVYFKDLVGSEELEALARKISNFIKYPERYERAQIEEHRGILLYGPSQTGKSQFAKALRTLIEDELGTEKKLPFINAKNMFDLGYTVEYIFWYASNYAPCILFFDEIDLIGTHRDKSPQTTSQLLTCMQGLDMSVKPIIVIGATNRLEQLDKALLVDGRFGKRILVDYPKYEHRKRYLETQLAKRCIHLTPEYIDCIAQETEGCTYNNLKRIITEAIILSSIETRPVQQKDFEQTLDTEIRKIQPCKNMSEAEKKVIAIYQAGKAVARHILQTQQQVVKITINQVNRDIKTADAIMTIENSDSKGAENDKLSLNKKDSKIKLGEVFTKNSNNHNDLLSDAEQEKECLALLAGTMALKLLFNETYTQCNKQDRADAMQIIYNMISHGEKIDDKTKDQALQIKTAYEQKIFTLLKEHKDLLIKISDMLLQQTTIDRYEWHNIISQ